MGRYIVKRLIEGIITLWLITLAVFFILRLGGGNPIEYMLPPEASQADIDKLTQAYGFDKPLIHQYWIFNKKLLRGDLGDALAWDKRPTIDVVWDRIPATFQLATASMLFAVVLGVVIGAVSASRPDSLFDRVGRITAIVGQSMPVFWVGLLLILLFSVYLGWLPSAGGIDRLGWKGIIMPALSLGFFLVASHMRIVRSTMLEVLESDYIKMVRAKGLPTRMVIWKHAFKNASIPVFTLFFVNFAALISGAVVTETIFAWPGIGRLLVDSLILRDYPTTQTVIFFAAAFIVFINIMVDVMYAWLDPRIRVV
ncbi:MAG: ABC transporter permease [Candidatus Tectomicrobia bacterium]|nr:ABC transporter permease [Candidatus Tectomicrobia bacterium]